MKIKQLINNNNSTVFKKLKKICKLKVNYYLIKFVQKKIIKLKKRLLFQRL